MDSGQARRGPSVPKGPKNEGRLFRSWKWQQFAKVDCKVGKERKNGPLTGGGEAVFAPGGILRF